MAAASYTSDLVDLHTIETTPTSGEFTGYTTGGTPAVDTDYPIQGSQHLSAAMTKTGLGSIGVDNGANISWTSGHVFLVWGVFLPAGAVNTDAAGGLRVLVGSALTAFDVFYVGGRDFGRYPLGGWMNFAVDPEVTPNATTGTPTGYRWVGFGVDCTSAISKGNPMGLDAVRYGRAELRINGGDLANGYATFTGAATVNDSSSNRWGLLQEEAGSYRWKGLLTLGFSSAVDFRDSNRNIVVDNTRKVTSSFNRIEVRQATSRVDWTNVSFQALGTVSKGELEVIDDADVNLLGCSFADMATFVFLGGSSVEETTFRRCGLVTPNGASFVGNIVTGSTASIAVTTAASGLANMQGCEFISGGTGHGLEITGSAGEYSLIGHKFTGYAGSDGSTGNEAVYVNISTGSVTLNVTSGGSTPSIRTAGATVTVVAAVAVTLTGLRDNTEVRVYAAGTTTELAGTEAATAGTTDDRSFTFSLANGTEVDIQIFAVAYEPVRLEGFTVPTADSSVPIEQRFDRNYANP